MGRREKEASKLMRKGFNVELKDDSIYDFLVDFRGPPDSLYHGYVWKVHVELEDSYPREPPIINFETKIYHPNIDLNSGFICVTALDKEHWDPNFELDHVFEFILPQVLSQPNFDDPYNEEASDLYRANYKEYADKVESFCLHHANPAA